MQIFRSIDTDCGVLKSERLFPKKGLLYDMSIQLAYIHHIRRAKRFLYIENQYFMGSSHFWINNPRQGCNNIIPVEIAEKIAAKIRAKEPFHVYVNIPMWPEGVTSTSSVQEIIHWQYLTVEMMYNRIALALAESDLEKSPFDYLTFYCLGNRTQRKAVKERPVASTDGERLFDRQRAPIYIHSKHLIVDDEYMIMGSANINERSMSGTRDTEIAFGAFQPRFLTERDACGPRGYVQAFRMQLWAAHLGIKSADELESFREPHTSAVINGVRTRAEKNWSDYMQEEIVEMSGQLMTYPYKIEVEEPGFITVKGIFENFPDTTGTIIGAPQSDMPDIISM